LGVSGRRGGWGESPSPPLTPGLFRPQGPPQPRQNPGAGHQADQKPRPGLPNKRRVTTLWHSSQQRPYSPQTDAALAHTWTIGPRRKRFEEWTSAPVRRQRWGGPGRGTIVVLYVEAAKGPSMLAALPSTGTTWAISDPDPTGFDVFGRADVRPKPASVGGRAP